MFTIRPTPCLATNNDSDKNLKRKFDLMKMIQNFGKSAIFTQNGEKCKAPPFFIMQFFITVYTTLRLLF